jgi:hypothetical protein
MLAATFHPELTSDTAVHEHFIQMAEHGAKNGAKHDTKTGHGNGHTHHSSKS